MFQNIIIFVKNIYIDDNNIQSFKYDTILFLTDIINSLCYNNKFKHISIPIYNILLTFANKDINKDTIDYTFNYLYYSNLNNLLT